MRVSVTSLALTCTLTATAWSQTPPPSGAIRAGRPLGVVAVAPPVFCREGKTASGRCVNQALAQAARFTSCVATQSLLSTSGGLPCATVYQDDQYRYPNAVFADTKRALDIAFNRQSSSALSYGVSRTTGFGPSPFFLPFSTLTLSPRTGPGTPNPPRYPIF